MKDEGKKNIKNNILLYFLQILIDEMYDRIRFSDDLINIIKKLQIYIFKSPDIGGVMVSFFYKFVNQMI